jgi:HD-GYP domain-containing protein (c-di-GMP phosphodiesterase class II)
VARLEPAALLHDLGRATVSNAVWDKLDPDEAGEELRWAARVRHLDADAVSAVLEAAGQRPATVNRDLLPAG